MFWIVAAAISVVLIVAALAWRPIRSALREEHFARARREFHQQRERLEAKFLELAAGSGKPRGLRWTDCDFDDDVAYARDRRTGELISFVAVEICFEAVEGGGMEEVEAVTNVRAATAVFHYSRGRWHTHGRVLFNLQPTEAIRHYHREFEMVGQEIAHRPV